MKSGHQHETFSEWLKIHGLSSNPRSDITQSAREAAIAAAERLEKRLKRIGAMHA